MDIESMNDDLDEFSRSQDEMEDDDQEDDTEYEEEVIQSNKRQGGADGSSRVSRLAGI